MDPFKDVETCLMEHLPELIENFQDDLQELKESLNELNISEVRRIAHGIKGAAGSIGLSDIQNSASAVEKLSIKIAESDSDFSSGSQELSQKIDNLSEKIAQAADCLEEKGN